MLSLGTVQFGMPYGATNRKGKPSEAEVREIVATALEAGMMLDTASGYGDAEAVLGRVFEANRDARIVTKTPGFSDRAAITEHDVETLHDSFEASLAHLGRQSIYGLLLHYGEDSLRPGGARLLDALQDIKKFGRAEKVGVSVYSPEDLQEILKMARPDIVQLPFSIADQRFIKSGHLARLKEMGIEIQARSVFLQGILLAETSDLPAHFKSDAVELSKIHRAISGAGRLRACLGFVAQRAEIDTIVVGVTNVQELRQILEAVSDGRDLEIDYADLAIDDTGIIDPRTWRI